jgi:hypothetical protein
VIEPRGAGTAGLVEAVAPHGFALRIDLSRDVLRDARLLPMVHAPTEIPFDVVIAGPGLDQELLDRAHLVDVGGAVAPVISVEDLVALKLLAGRRKDVEDVRGILLEQHGRVELARTRDVLSALEAASDRRGLVARLDRLVRAADAEHARTATRTRSAHRRAKRTP